MIASRKLLALCLMAGAACIASLCAVILVGCASDKLDRDVFPDAAQCSQARDQAIRWYQDRYHETPQCPPCRVTHESKPMNGMGGWTTGKSIHIWMGQLRDETHEWRHWLAIHNGKGGSEEAVR
jgi:hypothetical protein